MTGAPLAYLVCALPRSGGRLLARGLRASGAVPAPEPRFWSGWRGHDACTRQQLRLGPEAAAAGGALGAIRAAAAGGDPHRGFAAEVRWPELDHVLRALRLLAPSPDAPAGAVTDGDLLAGFLPGLRFIHLTRHDKAAQAVAWWYGRHHGEACGRTGRVAVPTPGRLDVDPRAVEQLERRLRADEWRWLSFFTRSGIEPLVVSYESLFDEPEAAVRRVLRFLDVPGADAVPLPAAAAPVHDAGLARAEAGYARWRQGRARIEGHRASASVSVILTGHGSDADLGAAARALRATAPDDVEIVVVDDRPHRPGAAPDHPAPAGTVVVGAEERPGTPAAARNLGAGRAVGETLVFLDAARTPPSGWLGPLRTALAAPSVAAAGPPAAPRPDLPGCPAVPVVDGGCLAVRRRDFEAVGGFDAGMLTGAVLDVELCLHLWRRGRRCRVVDGAEAVGAAPAADGGGSGDDGVLHDLLRLATAHLGPDDLAPAFEAAARWEGFADVYRRLVGGDVFERRRRIMGAAVPGEPWACERLPVEAGAAMT